MKIEMVLHGLWKRFELKLKHSVGFGDEVADCIFQDLETSVCLMQLEIQLRIAK